MSSIQLLAKTQRASESGLSLAEVVVSAGVITIAGIALANALYYSIESTKGLNSREAVAFAINTDLASIHKLNDYYVCFTGSCHVASLEPPPPNQFQYAPSSSDSIAFAKFVALCQNNPANLSQALVERIGASTTIRPENSTITITRTARLHPNNGSDSHLYMVEWSPPQGPKTQIVLSPPVSRWCP